MTFNNLLFQFPAKTTNHSLLKVKTIEKPDIYGIIGSIIIGILLLLLLFFCKLSFSGSQQEEEGGLSVNFGNEINGEGAFELTPMSEIEPSEAVPTLSASEQASLQTQQLEESVEVRENRRKEQQRKDEELRKQREEEENQRRIAEENQRKATEIRNRTQTALAGSGGVGNSDASSQGDGSGSGNQGQPDGGLSGGNTGGGSGNAPSINIGGGRVPVGTLSEPDAKNTSGVIVIDIIVDINGNVVEAYVGQGTNITDRLVLNSALNEARKAKFTKGDKKEVGTITYRFTLQ
jgi:hypothetical protein